MARDYRSFEIPTSVMSMSHMRANGYRSPDVPHDISSVPLEVLVSLCDEWRAGVFNRARKIDPDKGRDMVKLLEDVINSGVPRNEIVEVVRNGGWYTNENGVDRHVAMDIRDAKSIEEMYMEGRDG